MTKLHVTRRVRRGVALAGMTISAGMSWAANAPTQSQLQQAEPPSAQTHKSSPMRQQRMSGKAQNYYVAAWGVDQLKVSYTASGNLIRFSYRVTDPERAKLINDKRSTPYLLGVRSRAVLQVPVMDKVGMLRTATAPQAGQEYWMVFSNKGNLVKPGDRVNVFVGAFHADGLMVE